MFAYNPTSKGKINYNIPVENARLPAVKSDSGRSGLKTREAALVESRADGFVVLAALWNRWL